MIRGRLQLNKLQIGKVAGHVVQALFTSVAFIVLIAMFAQKGKSDGRAIWYAILCVLSIPAWIYLAVFWIWPRTVRFANAFAMAGIDVVYTIFWFSAVIALAVWNNEGQKKGAKDKKISGSGNCTTFAYGSEKKCELAKAAVGLGVVVFLLWLATSGLSIYFIIRWRKGHDLPWENARPKGYGEPTSIEAQTKDAWSTDHDAHDEHDDDGSDDGTVTPRPTDREDDEHMLLQDTGYQGVSQQDHSWEPARPPSYHAAMPHETDFRTGP